MAHPAVTDRDAPGIALEAASLPATHTLFRGDARDLSWIPDETVHLVITSPPYWTLKEYNESPGQMGHIEDYKSFMRELDRVWKECFRALVPGGRVVCVVGDVCLSRREAGRHYVMPLHADIMTRGREIGFDNLTPIFWNKIANANYEVAGGGGFLGKPFEPNAIIKNDVEYILFLRKPGAYRQPTEEQRRLSRMTKEEYGKWFKSFWTDVPGESTRNHPAPFPIELAYRLVRMFSFVGDTVLDPFSGSFTTTLAAMRCGRNSIGNELDKRYFQAGVRRIQDACLNHDLFNRTQTVVIRDSHENRSS